MDNSLKDVKHFPLAQHVEGSETIVVHLDNLYVDPVHMYEKDALYYFVSRLKRLKVPYRVIQYYKKKQDPGPRLALFVQRSSIDRSTCPVVRDYLGPVQVLQKNLSRMW